jgi:protein-S-isoprenylcysteine O-methyltransferase Ste14
LSNVVQELFNNESIRVALFRIRYVVGPLFLIPVGYFMQPRLFWIGFAVSMVGQVIQTWCFASLVKNRELTIRGPYLLSRNPMYLGRYFMLLGFAILLGNVWILLAYTVVYYLYMDTRIRREERRLLRVFGKDYEAYCDSVPRLFPSLRRAGEPELWYWDWAPFRENNAQWNIVGTLASFAAVYLAWWLLR